MVRRARVAAAVRAEVNNISVVLLTKAGGSAVARLEYFEYQAWRET